MAHRRPSVSVRWVEMNFCAVSWSCMYPLHEPVESYKKAKKYTEKQKIDLQISEEIIKFYLNVL